MVVSLVDWDRRFATYSSISQKDWIIEAWASHAMFAGRGKSYTREVSPMRVSKSLNNLLHSS
jgi:hypothetical protein